jgi:dihydrolipoamide dehydrogenase
LFRRHGVRLLRGQALLKETGRLIIQYNAQAPEEITWDKLIIAAGSSPAALPFAPFDGQVVLSSTDLLNLTKVPASLIIIGAGAIGCEFACILRAFGAEVTMVEGLDRVLPVESVDAECSKTLERELKKQKIRILTRTMISRIERTGSGVRVVAGAAPLHSQPARDKETSLEIEAEAVLVCIGRRPSRHGLDLALLGIETDGQGWIRVDNRLQTSHPDVFAIGDILGPGRPMLAHVASAEGEVAAVNAMGGNRLMTYEAVPLGVYSMPEVACVGVSEAAARRQGLDVLTGSALFRTVGLAQVIGDIAGLAKIVAEKDGGRIVGVHLIGPHATELIGEATLAVRNCITIQELTQTIHAHPTLSEVIYEAARMMNESP